VGLALLAAGPAGAEEPRTIRDLTANSTLIVIGEVTGTTAYAHETLFVHAVRVERALQGRPRAALAIVEEKLSSLRLFREGQRVLVFLRPAPGHSWLRKHLPQGEYHASVGGRSGVSEIAPEADERVASILAAAAAGVSDQALIHQELRSGHTRFVQDAVAQLALRPDLTREDLEAIRVCLSDARVDDAAKAQVVRLLGEREVSDAVATLRSLEPSSGVLLAARAEALAKLGFPPKTEETQAYLGHPDAEVRRFGVKQLATSSEQDAVPTLEAAALHDADRQVRIEAVRALARSGQAEAVQALTRTFDSDDIHVQRASAQALHEMGGLGAEEALHELVFSGRSYQVQARALFLLFARGATRSDPAIERIAREHPDPRIRKLIREGIQPTRPPHPESPRGSISR
jgi:HEAT repeat protein